MQTQRILFIDETSRAQQVAQAIVGADCVLAGCYNDTGQLSDLVAKSEPDLLLIVVEKPNDMLFARLAELKENSPLPVVLFSDDPREESIESAVKAGVNSYIFNGLDAARIIPILQMAELRFAETNKLKADLQSIETRLNNRITVERAKGLLMDTQGMKEQDAYRALQKTAMDHATSIVDIAEKTITVLKGASLGRTA